MTAAAASSRAWWRQLFSPGSSSLFQHSIEGWRRRCARPLLTAGNCSGVDGVVMGGAGVRSLSSSPSPSLSSSIAAIRRPGATGGLVALQRPPFWGLLAGAGGVGGLFGNIFARFSSTLKKRRSKMNKHKLKKRKKLMRNKNKKNL